MLENVGRTCLAGGLTQFCLNSIYFLILALEQLTAMGDADEFLSSKLGTKEQ